MVAEALALSGIHHSPAGRLALRGAEQGSIIDLSLGDDVNAAGCAPATAGSADVFVTNAAQALNDAEARRHEFFVSVTSDSSDAPSDTHASSNARMGADSHRSLIVDEAAFGELLEAPCDTPTLWLAAVALEQYWGRELPDTVICGCTTLHELLALAWKES